MSRRSFLRGGAVVLLVALCGATVATTPGAAGVAVGAAASPPSQTRPEPPRQWADLPEREEIVKRFGVASHASVEVTGIAGPVEVETTQGGTAEIYVMRSAETRRELDCYQTEVEETASGLRVRHVQFSGRPGCASIRSRQRVKLSVPRSAALSLGFIAGDVRVGATEGPLKLDNIAGHVSAAPAGEAAMNSLARGLSLTVARLSGRGIRISGVVGDVDLKVADDLNARVLVRNLSGIISTRTPKARRVADGDATRVQIGSGGTELSLSNVRGDLTIRPA